jgi:hypothetical protein
MMVLSHAFISERGLWKKPLRILSVISLLLIMAGRLYLVADIGPDNSLKKRFHFQREWAEAIAGKTGDTPVVFYNSYQRASIFWFYSGKPSHSFNTLRERRNNYNFWPTEINLLGKPVYIADVYSREGVTDSVLTKYNWTGWRMEPLFTSPGSTRIIEVKAEPQTGADRKMRVTFNREMSPTYLQFLTEHPDLQESLVGGIFREKKLVEEIPTGITIRQLARTASHEFILNLEDLPAGKYYLRFGVLSINHQATHNSDKTELVIK